MNPLPIITSRSAVACAQTCMRKRYFQYEAANGTATPGWERRKLAIPLLTGIWVHKGLEAALGGSDAATAALEGKNGYLAAVAERGLGDPGPDEAAVIEEQAAHVEALVLAWCRVRLPIWQAEYDLVEVEVEDRVPLSGDVTLAVRADAVVRRKADHRMFVVNFKTVGTADYRWSAAWETDMQLMTELLAAERRHGGEFGGVIIEGLIKGRRTAEKDNVGTITGYRDSTPLLYGYKVDANPPLTSLEYGWEYTRKKGWYRFPVWKEQFQQTSSNEGSLAYWINWLPEEVVAQQFITVPAIMRDGDKIASKVAQIVSIEQGIRAGVEMVALANAGATFLNHGKVEPVIGPHALDRYFPQSEKSCHYPGKCSFYDACWTNGVAGDMAGSGLYQPREDHHAIPEAEEVS